MVGTANELNAAPLPGSKRSSALIRPSAAICCRSSSGTRSPRSKLPRDRVGEREIGANQAFTGVRVAVFRIGVQVRWLVSVLSPSGGGVVRGRGGSRSCERSWHRRATGPRLKPNAAHCTGWSDAAASSLEANSASGSEMPAISKMRRAGPGGHTTTSSRSCRPSTARAQTSTLTPLESETSRRSDRRRTLRRFRGSPRPAPRSAARSC